MQATLESFQLTPAEAKLALSIAEGTSLKNFCLETGISMHTARNQLKAIFAKVGVSRQVELALVILSIRNGSHQ